MKVNHVVEKRKPIQVNEAIKKVMNFAKEGTVYYVPIEQSYGCFLGEDLVASTQSLTLTVRPMMVSQSGRRTHFIPTVPIP